MKKQKEELVRKQNQSEYQKKVNRKMDATISRARSAATERRSVLETRRDNKDNKWDTWHENYNRVLQNGENLQNIQRDTEMALLDKLQKGFNKIQTEYERRLIKTSQDHFIKTERSIVCDKGFTKHRKPKIRGRAQEQKQKK